MIVDPGWEFWGAPSGDGGFVSLFDLRERLRADQQKGHLAPPAAGAVGDAGGDPTDVVEGIADVEPQ